MMPKKEDWFAIAMVVSVIGVGGWVVAHRSGEPSSSSTTEATEATKEIFARAEAIDAAERMLRDSLRDPDSLQMVDARASSDGQLVCMSYRARNGFGGMNLEHAFVFNGHLVHEDCEAMRQLSR